MNRQPTPSTMLLTEGHLLKQARSLTGRLHSREQSGARSAPLPVL